MATRFNLSDTAPPYTPATYKGAWDSTAACVTKKLFPRYAGQTYETKQYVQLSTSSADTEWDGLLYRGVSDPLAAGTIGTGTINVGIGIREDNANSDCFWHLHVYVTQGDSDAVRGTLLNDYRENTTNEFATSNTGTALQAAASLSSVVVSAGDRLVVEIGYVKRSVNSANGVLSYGVPSVSDVTIGSESYSSNKASWIQFSETLSFSNAGDLRVTQGYIEGLSDSQCAARVTQGYIEVIGTPNDIVERLSQVLVEYTDENLSTTARASQVTAEILAPTVVASRATQVLIELLTPTVIQSRFTQMLAEHALGGEAFTMRGTQTIVELLGKTSTYCGEPPLTPAALCGKADVLAWLEWTVPVKEA